MEVSPSVSHTGSSTRWSGENEVSGQVKHYEEGGDGLEGEKGGALIGENETNRKICNELSC